MIASILDRLLAVAKWPLGLMSLIFLIPLALGWRDLFFDALESLETLVPLSLGCLGYLVISRLVVGKKRQGWFSTLEHELTHAFFALITFHKVAGIKTTATAGGVIHIIGGSNWLIVISPYFFPTLSFFLMLLLILVGAQNQVAAGLMLGFTMAYHLISTKHELHKHQTDLIEVGFLYSFLFLPGANLFSYGILFAYSVGGLPASMDYMGDVISFYYSMLQ